MSELFNVYEAKTRFSELLDRARAGEEFVLAKAGKPYAKLMPFVQEKPKRVPGLLKGKIRMTDDFDAPMSDEELKLWYGDKLPPLVDGKK